MLQSYATRIASVIGAFTIAASSSAPIVAHGQSLLDRSPNISGDWSGAPGTLYFHFIHRFSTSPAPERKVTNVPTFLVGTGLPFHFFAGLNYATNSTLAPRFPNEWELFTRWAPLSQDLGAPLDAGGQVGYNNAAEGVDGEVSAARRFGPMRLLVAGRALSDPFQKGHQRFAIAAGSTIRVGNYVALAGDVASLTGRDSTERVAWSAGVHVAIPLTPHTLSLQVTNTLVETLQGVSRGTDRLRYGFEFTIPLTLGRYFGKRETQSADANSVSPDGATAVTEVAAVPAEPAPAENVPVASNPVPIQRPPVSKPASERPVAIVPVPTTASPPKNERTSSPARTPAAATPRMAAKVVKNGMKNISYMQARMQIEVGTTVVWSNTDPLAHTVTAVDKSFNSGLVDPGKTFRHTFTKAGTYTYYCMPHPFMKGVIVVKE